MADPSNVLAIACAELLQARGLGEWRPDGPAFTKNEQGIKVGDRKLPTTYDAVTLLTPSMPVADGRGDLIYRLQIHIRRRASLTATRDDAWTIRQLFDERENTPNVLGISWSWWFSGIEYGDDGQGRHEIAQTFYFRGRRPQTP